MRNTNKAGYSQLMEYITVRAFRTGLIEFLMLAALGLVVGFGVNAARSRGAIKPTKNYFALTRSANSAKSYPTPDLIPKADAAAAKTTEQVQTDSDRTKKTASDAETQSSDPDAPYTVVSLDEVIDIFNDPDTESGLNVFIDARNDESFHEGHIPGAVQFFPYEVERYLDNVLERTNGVMKVVVYCNGGECTDSKYACRELLEVGVPEDAIYLFAQGWEAWTSKDLPVATGEGE